MPVSASEHEHIGGRWPPLTRGVAPTIGRIPTLARVDPNLLGLALVTTGGEALTAGDINHTGLPPKSGVGGGLIAVSPGKFGIAVVSPPLDDAGNSVRAQRAIAAISNALGGNPLAPTAR
jgi:glutaminase